MGNELQKMESRALVKQELIQPKSGDQKRFIDALTDNKISNGNIENIKEALRYVMVKIGLRSQNWPNDVEKAILIDHILKYYSGHTPQEIRIAFDMAIEGKLGVEVNCYENFSCLYFSNIMSGYREWAKQEYEQLPKQIPKIEYKEDMSREAMMDWFNAEAKKIRAGEITVDFVPLMLYEWMDDNGNISATPAQKYEYLQRAAEYRQDQLAREVEKRDDHNNRWRLSTFVTMKNNGYFEGEEADRVKSLAKKMLLYDMIINTTE